MKKIKWMRIITIVVIVTVIFPNLGNVWNVKASNMADDTVEISFLKSIKLLDDNFIAEEKIVKSKFAFLIIKMLYPDLDFSIATDYNTQIFKDVDNSYEYYPYIYACKNLDIINGNDEGYFYPEQQITLNESIVMLINALGYKQYADAKGGYPSGYFAVAKQYGLLKELNNVSEVTGEVAAKLLYNSLFIDLAGTEIVSEDGYVIRIDNSKNILSERLGIKEYDVRLVDNGITSLSGASGYDTDRIVLYDFNTMEKISAYTDNVDLTAYLGSRLKVFIYHNRDTGRDELIHFNLHKKSKETYIPAQWIISSSADRVEYIEDKTKIKSETLIFDNGGPVIVFNGKHITDKTLNELIPKDGMLRAVDPEGDGKYSFLEIFSFNIYNGNTAETARYIVSDSIGVSGDTLKCMLNPARSLDISEDVIYKVVHSDVETLDDIVTHDIISVAESPELIDGKKLLYLFVSQNSIQGKPDYISSDNRYISVNGKEFEISSGLTDISPAQLKNLDFEQNMDFMIDAQGKIAYIINYSQSKKNYGYLIKADKKQISDEYVIVKMLTREGTVETKQVAAKVKVDGKQLENAEDILLALKTRPSGSLAISGAPAYGSYYERPVIYELNSDGEIKLIDTDTPNELSSDYNHYTSETFISYSNTEIENNNALKAGYRSLRTSPLTKNVLSIDSRFYITGNTVIMNVPDIDCFGVDRYVDYMSNKNDNNIKNAAVSYNMIKLYELDRIDKNYRILSLNDLTNTKAYDIQAYDIDKSTGVASLVVIRGSMQPYFYQSSPKDALPLSIFVKKTTVYDENTDQMMTKIYYTTDI